MFPPEASIIRRDKTVELQVDNILRVGTLFSHQDAFWNAHGHELALTTIIIVTKYLSYNIKPKEIYIKKIKIKK